MAVLPPGTLVDIGGRRLHVQVMGAGSPTVIFEAGMLSMSLQWARMAPILAQVTRVIVYDRAGYGWSDPGPGPRTAAQAVGELRRLLGVLGIGPPYLAAGHSYGGLVSRLFAALCPGEVAGAVLFDPSHPDQFAHTGADFERLTRMVRALPALARSGVLRGLSYVPSMPMVGVIAELPPRERGLARHLLATSRHFEAAVAEWDAQRLSFPDVAATPLPPGLRLTVASAGERSIYRMTGLVPAEFLPGMDELNAELAAKVPGGKHLILPWADHQRVAGVSQRTAPPAAAIVQEMVEAIRQGE